MGDLLSFYEEEKNFMVLLFLLMLTGDNYAKISYLISQINLSKIMKDSMWAISGYYEEIE